MNRQKKKMRFLARIISMLLVLIMMSEEFLGSGNIVLAAEAEEITVVEEETDAGSNDPTDTEEDLSEEIDTENLDILFEMEEKREQSGKHYRMSDGSIMASDYGMDIHYQKDGLWEDIDNRFVYEAATADDSMDGFATAEGDVEFKFAPDTSEGEVVKATSGAYSVSFDFLGSADASENEAPEVTGEDTVISEETALQEFLEAADTAESTAETGTVTEPENIDAAVPETAVPITFVKGDILNAEAAAEALTGTAAETSVLAAAENEESLADAVQPVAGLLAEGLGGALDESGAAGTADTEEEIWAEVGSSEVDASGKDSLMKQAALENVVTSVGYEDVMQGISLQYVAHGSSLKEYILVSEPQDSYVYVFKMDLEGLVPQMQEDGGILLADEETGETVYEIPAAYMTDAAGAYSDAVEMEITPAADGTYLLCITADADWIGAKGRVFPVQIDPTLNKRLTSSGNVRGNYVKQGEPGEPSTNYGEMYVGYDSSGNRNMKTYIQLRNLPQLPADSVVCTAKFNMAVLVFSQVAWPKLHIQAREVKNTSWDSKYTWNNKPASEDLVIDQRTITSSELYKYVGWNITSLVKAHYDAGNKENAILAFSLEAYGTMSNSRCANTALNLLWDGAEPIFQIFYRDTRGVEDYYTYQTQSLGNAGTGYISDYTSQLTVAKTVASYDSTTLPYDIGLVYNSANSGKYFTGGGEIHSTDFTYMNSGTGWKLTLQETVVPVSITDVDGTETYLVYNDADGTEHYFQKSESDSSKYEDEDGLNLTITKKSAKVYEMTDKKDNVKTFTDGYLTGIADANGNKINIVYLTENGIRRLSKVTTVPNGGTEKTLFTFTFLDEVNTLFEIEDYAGRRVRFTYRLDKNSRYQLEQVIRYDGTNTVEARYLYDADSLRMSHAYDMESGTGVQYRFRAATTGYRVYEYWEYAAADIDEAQTVGASARTWTTQMRQARYRFSGADGVLSTTDNTVVSEDDVITTYVFNSAGQTINAQSENESTKQLLGVTASAYTKNSGTDKTNNRMNASVSSGQAGVNLLVNGGFEKTTGDAADDWTPYASGGAVACRDATSGLNHSGQKHYNLFGNSTSAVCSISQEVSVTGGETYTFSAYVNTRYASQFGDGSGVYLYVRQLSDQSVPARSVRIDHRTDEGLDGGWQRISTTFTAQASGQMLFVICSAKIYGTVMADDIQLERGDAASRFNHVYNGSFEKAGNGWTVSGTGTVEATQVSEKHGKVSLRMLPSAPEAVMCAVQTIPLYRSAGTTFLLSGWGMGNSIPDLAEEIEGKNDASLRYWGITLTLNYSDGTASEHFHLPFCDYATNWQYAAMSITPKAGEDKVISTAELKLYYQNNANTAYFDSISLIEEPAQTYKYDKDGNLTSVKEKSEDEYEFDEATQNLKRAVIEGSGEYKYNYKTSGNKHLVESVENDNVTMALDYDAYGQTTETTLENNKKETTLTMTSRAEYNDGLLTSVTDNTGATTAYTYDGSRRVFKAADAAGTETITYYDDIWEYPKLSYQEDVVSVGNTYTKGNLTQIRRSGYSTAGDTSTGTAQEYNFTYDAFGKNTSVSIGCHPSNYFMLDSSH